MTKHNDTKRIEAISLTRQEDASTAAQGTETQGAESQRHGDSKRRVAETQRNAQRACHLIYKLHVDYYANVVTDMQNCNQAGSIKKEAHDQKFIPEIIDQLIKSGFSFLAPFCLVLPYGWIRLELHP
jgi:phage terminase large subunit-like protein